MKSNAGALKLLFRQLYLYKQLLSGKCDKGSKKEWPLDFFWGRLKLKTPFQVGGLRSSSKITANQLFIKSKEKCIMSENLIFDDVNSNWIFF